MPTFERDAREFRALSRSLERRGNNDNDLNAQRSVFTRSCMELIRTIVMYKQSCRLQSSVDERVWETGCGVNVVGIDPGVRIDDPGHPWQTSRCGRSHRDMLSSKRRDWILASIVM